MLMRIISTSLVLLLASPALAAQPADCTDMAACKAWCDANRQMLRSHIPLNDPNHICDQVEQDFYAKHGIPPHVEIGH